MSAMLLGGRYQVQDKIGAGGMATVFRGLDEVLGRTVAIPQNLYEIMHRTPRAKEIAPDYRSLF